MIKPNVIKGYRELYSSTAKHRVLEILFKDPEKEFSLSELSKESRVAKANIGKILKDFERKRIIRIEKLSKIWRIRSERASVSYVRGKILYNLNFIYNSGLIEYLVGFFRHPKSMILFGSFRKGEDVSDSDIDIAIESDEVKDYRIVDLNELQVFEKVIGKKIQVHLFNRKSVDNNLFNNIVNGIVLSGFLEVNK